MKTVHELMDEVKAALILKGKEFVINESLSDEENLVNLQQQLAAAPVVKKNGRGDNAWGESADPRKKLALACREAGMTAREAAIFAELDGEDIDWLN
jgi:hypothetical protein